MMIHGVYETMEESIYGLWEAQMKYNLRKCYRTHELTPSGRELWVVYVEPWRRLLKKES